MERYLKTLKNKYLCTSLHIFNMIFMNIKTFYFVFFIFYFFLFYHSLFLSVIALGSFFMVCSPILLLPLLPTFLYSSPHPSISHLPTKREEESPALHGLLLRIPSHPLLASDYVIPFVEPVHRGREETRDIFSFMEMEISSLTLSLYLVVFSFCVGK